MQDLTKYVCKMKNFKFIARALRLPLIVYGETKMEISMNRIWICDIFLWILVSLNNYDITYHQIGFWREFLHDINLLLPQIRSVDNIDFVYLFI